MIVIDRGASEDARRVLAESTAELKIAGQGDEFAYGFDKVGNVFVIKPVGTPGGGDRFGAGRRPAEQE